MILILTDAEDEHADALEPLLGARGVGWTRFDPAEFPDDGGLSLSIAAGGRPVRTLWRAPGRDAVALETVTAVWWRRPGFPGVPGPLAGTPAAESVRAEWCTVVADLLDSLDMAGVRILPAARPVADRAQNKQMQLILAARLGMEIPTTLVTSDPEHLLDFAASHTHLVSKRATPGLPMYGPPAGVGGTCEVFRYTDPVLPNDLLHADAVALCPMIFQAYVPKRLELRVTVVGDRVFAAAIDSQGTHRTSDDWRHYDRGRTQVLPYELPHDVTEHCLAMLDELGLCFGTFDLVVTPDDRHVFLELNPNGQYLWIEDLTGLPITEAVATYLADGADHTAAVGARARTGVPA